MTLLQQWSERVIGAATAGAPLRIRGGGTKDFYGNEPRGEVFDTRGWQGIESYEPSELVITAREAGVWQDVLPRRFRWVEVEGLEGVTSAGVLPLVASAPATLGGDFGAQPSLLGVESPQLRAPAQDVIRRELEGAPGVGVGEPR